MARKQTRKSCNLTEDRYARVHACAERLGRSVSSVMEALIRSVLEDLPLQDALDQDPLPPPATTVKPHKQTPYDGGARGGGVHLF